MTNRTPLVAWLLVLFAGGCTQSVSSSPLQAATSSAPASATADGNSPIVVSVDVATSVGSPQGLPVSFSVDANAVTMVRADAALDANGHAQAWFVSDAPGTYVVVAEISSASANAGSGLLRVQQSILFVAAGGPSAGPSPSLRVLASPSTLLADGNQASTVTVTGTSASGGPLSGQPVQLAVAGGREGADRLERSQGLLDGNGAFVTQLRSTQAGVRSVLAASGNATDMTGVEFVAGPVSSAQSSLVVAGQAGTADGLDAVLATVRARDAFGNAKVGQDVSLTVDANAAAVRPSSGVTDGNGHLSVRVTSSAVGPVQVAAQLADVTVSSVATFVSTPANLALSSLAVPAQAPVADGNQVAALLVTLRDAAGRPVANAPLTWSVDGGAAGAQLTPQAAVTDAAGTGAAGLASTATGPIGVTVQGAGVSLRGVVSFVAGPLSAALSTFVANAAQVVADGTSEATVTLSLRDAYRHPIAGAPVSLSTTLVGVRFSPVTGLTDAAGTFSAQLAGQRSGLAQVVASTTAAALGLNVQLVPGAPSVVASQLVASPATVVADGNDFSAVTLLLRDALGNAVADAPVALDTDATAALLAPAAGTTDALGVFATRLRGTEAGPVSVGLGVGRQRLATTVTFAAASPSVVASRLELVPAGPVLADGDASALACASLRDAYDNPTPSQLVRWASARPEDSVLPATSLTGATGRTGAHVRSTQAGLRLVTATSQNVVLQGFVPFVAGPAAGQSQLTVLPLGGVVADGSAPAQLRLRALDAYGNAVSGANVVLSASAANDRVVPSAGQTDADGVFAATWTSTRAESKTLRATLGDANAVALQASKLFVPGPFDAAHSAVTVAPAAIAAGGAASVVAVALRDAFDNPLPATAVDFSASSPLLSLLPSSGLTDADGRLQSTVSSVQAGVQAVVASVGGASLSANVAVAPAAASAAASRFAVAPATLVADGNALARGLLQLLDAYGNPVGGQAATFSSPSAAVRLTAAAAVTDGNGRLGVDVAATRAGTTSVVASAGAATLSVPLTLTAGPPSAAASALALAPNVLVADAASSSTATLTLRDGAGNPVGGWAVAFRASPGVGVALPGGSTTDADGRVQALLSASAAGPATLTADFATDSLAANLTFVAGAPAPSRSSLSLVSNAGITADGQSTATLSVVAQDAFGNPVAGGRGRLSASAPEAVVAAPNFLLDASGQASTAIACTRAGLLVVTAVVEGVALSAPVRFVPGPPDANVSLFDVSPSSVLDDGNAVAQIYLLAADAQANAVGQAPVSLTASGGQATLSPPNGATADDGTFVSSVAATVAETKTIAVDVGGTVLQADVNFVVGLPNDQTIDFSAAPASVTADGVATSTVTLSLRDTSSQPVAGANVQVAASGVAVTWSATGGTTDANGLWSTQISGTAVGLARLTAEVSGVRSVALVNLVAGQPNFALSTLTAAPPQAVADGNAGIALTARLVDDLGHPVASRAGTWTSGAAADRFAATSSTTDAGGIATNVLSTTAAGDGLVQFVGAGGSLSSPVRFVADRPAAVRSTITAAPGVLVADGNQAADVSVALADAYGNAVAGANVAFSSASGRPLFDYANGPNAWLATTDANGRCHVLARATRAGIESLLASSAGLSLATPVRWTAGPAQAAHSSLTSPVGFTVADGNAQAPYVVQWADAFGNPVANDLVTAVVIAGSGTVLPASGITDADGRLAIGLASQGAGTTSLLVQESTASLSLAGNANFVAGAVSLARSSWTASAPSIVAGDANGVAVTLVARDAFGNARANVPVVVSIGGQGGVAQPISGVTDGDGRFSSAVQSTSAENKDVTASFAGGQKALSVQVLPAAASAAASGLAASPAMAVADNVTPMQLVARVRDAYGNAVSGQNVTFSSSQPRDAFAATTAPSDAAGVASVSLVSPVAGARTFVASVGGGNVSLPYVFSAGSVSSALSRLSVSPNVVVADGSAAGVVTAVLVDALQNPVAGQAVSLTAFGSGNALGRALGTSDANGLFVTTLSSTVAEGKTLTATALGVSWAGTATFVSGPPAYATSSLSASPLTITANGNSVATLVATVRDAFGNPCGNAAVQFAATGASNAFSRATGTTDGTGALATTLASSQAESKTVQFNAGAIARSINLSFVPGAPDATTSTLTLSPASQRADAASTIGVTVVARDARGNAVAGQAVSLSAPSSALRFAAASGITAANGSLSTTAASSSAGNVLVTATLGSTSLSQPAWFLAGPADANASSVTASPSQLVANGNATTTVTVAAIDAFGNFVGNQPVSLSVSGGNNWLANANGVTDATGAFATTLRSTRAEGKVVSAALGAISVSAPIAFVTGGASADTSTLAQVGGSAPVLADGASVATLRLLAKDSQGNPLTNQAVSFSVTGSNNSLQATPSTTDGNGAMILLVRSTRAETKQAQATVGGVTLSSAVSFVAGAINAAHSSLSVSPNALLADGNSLGAIGLWLADAYDNPVGGAAATLSTSSDATLSANQLVTDAMGMASATLRSRAAGNKAVTASWPGGALTTSVRLTPGAVANANSSLLVSPNSVVADGVSQATLSVALADAFGNAIPYERVSFAASGAAGATSFANASAVTDVAGKANVTVSSTVTGSRLLTAQAQGTSLSAGMAFLPGPPSSLASTLTANPNAVTADGTSGTTLLLTVRDAFGNPLPNQAVAFTAAGGSNVFGQASGATSDGGTFLSPLRSTSAGLRTITASVGGTAISTPVSFLPGPPSVATSSWTASPTQAVADGQAPMALTLALRDAQNNPVANAAVVVSLSGTASSWTPNGGVTDGNGMFQTQVTSTRAQSEVATAASGALSLTVPCLFVAGQASSQSTVLTASPNVIVADGNAFSLISVSAADALGNPVANANVRFAAAGAALRYSTADAVTDGNGRASTQASATAAGQRLLTATVGGIGVSTPLVLQAGAVQVAHSSLSFAPATVTADGNSAVAITATLRDLYDNPVVGQGVLFAATGSAVALSSASATTDATGSASTALRSSVAEPKQVSATAGGQVLAGNVSFLAGAVSNATSAFVASPNQLVANGSDATVVTLAARDAFGNRAPGRTVSFVCTGSNNQLGANTATTDANGVASTQVQSTVAENKTVLATADGTSFSLPLRFVPGPASAIGTSLTALPAQGLADGASPVVLTLLAADAFGNPLSSQGVSWSSGGSLNVLSSSGSLTDAAGFASVQLRSRRAEIKTVNAQVAGLGKALSVPFVAGAADANVSTLALSPPAAVADGNQAIRLTVLAADAFGNPVGNQALSVDVGGANVVLDANVGVTDAGGTFVTQLRSTRADAKSVAVTLGGARLTGSASFVAGSPNAVRSSLTMSPNANVVADGTASAVARVTLLDAFGNPVPAQTVGLAASGDGVTWQGASGSTNAAGSYLASLVSTKAEAKSITLTAGGMAKTSPVQFVAGPPSSASTLLVAQSTGSLVADGAAAAALTGQVADAYGNPVGLQGWSLAATGSRNTVSPASGTTDANGRLSASLTSLRAEAKTVSLLSGAATASTPVVFVAGAPNGTLSTLVVAPSTGVTADNVAAATVAATVVDAFGNAVPNQPFTLACSGSNNGLGLAGGNTDAAGSLSTTLRSQAAEAKTVTLTAGAVTLSGNVTFVAGSPNASLSRFTASPNANVSADGNATSTVTLSLADAFGNAVQGQNVSVTSSSSVDTIVPRQGQTGASGAFSATVSSVLAGSKALTASAGSLQFVSPIGFVAGPPSSTTTTLLASPTTLSVGDANGAASTLTAAVFDAQGNPVPNQAVTLASSNGNDVFGATAGTTDATGRFATSLRSTKAESKLVTLAAGSASATAALNFVAGGPNVALSALVASPSAGVVADGNQTTRLTLSLLDSFGNPVPNRAFTIASSNANDLFSANNGATTLAGTLSTLLAGTQAGTRLVAVTGGNLTFNGAITLVPGPLDAGHCVLTASPNANVAADAVATSVVTLLARDYYGNPVAGQSVALSTSSPNVTFGTSGGSTDGNGRFAASVATSRAGSKLIAATAGAFTGNVSVSYVAGSPNAAASSFSALPAAGTVADGNAAVAVRVSLQDAYGNVVSGQSVALASSNANDVFAPSSGTTDANGLFVAALRSTRAEGKAVSVSAGPASATLSVAFVAGSPNLGHSSFLAVPTNNVVADNNAQVSLSAHVADAFDNPTANVALSLAATGSNNTFAPASGTTGANGNFVASWTSTRAEGKTVTWTAAGLSASATATFVSGPVNANTSPLAIVPNGNILADGNYTTQVNFTANDAFANAVGGQNVTFSCSPNCSLSPASRTTSATGLASSALASTQVGSATVTASAGGANVALPVTFVSPLPGASITLSPNAITAGGNTQVGITLRLADAGNQTLANTSYRLMGSVPGVAFSRSTGASDANGAATATLTSLYAGQQSIRAYFGSRVVNANLTVASKTPPCASGAPIVAGQTWAYNSSWSPFRMAWTDLNGDGKADLAFTSSGATPFFVVLLNDGNDKLLPARQFAGTGYQYGIAVADVTGDGNPDVITASNDRGFVTVYQGAGNGNFSQLKMITVGSGPYDVVAADFDADGAPDVAVSNASSANVSLLWGLGNGNFSMSTLATDATPHGLAHGFLDSDGQRDLVVACSNTSGNGLDVFLNQGSRTFAAKAAYLPGVAANYVGIADLNNDGYGDVAASVQQSNGLLTYFASASGTLTLNGNFSTTSGGPSAIGLYDLNADGNVDVVQGQASAGRSQIRMNLGNGVLQSPNTVAGGSTVQDLRIFRAANGNAPTLVSVHASGSVAFVGDLDRLALRKQSVSAVGTSYPRDFAAADFNKDGAVDLFVLNFYNQSPVYFGVAGGNLQFASAANSTLSLSSSGLTVRAGDVNGDDAIDLVAATSGPAIDTFLNQGAGTFAARKTLSVSPAIEAMLLADWNGDGSLDVLGVSGNTNGTLKTFTGSGNGNFQLATQVITGTAPAGLAVADFDQDGALDVAVCNGGKPTWSCISARGTAPSTPRSPTQLPTARARCRRSTSTATAMRTSPSPPPTNLPPC